MAQKKITDLQLRSDFDETCNLPVDDPSQTWRTTGGQILDYVADNIEVPEQSYMLQNLALLSSVATSALTISLKQKNGSSDASATHPVTVSFRHSTLTNGSFEKALIIAGLSIVVPASATLGQVDNQPSVIYVYLINNAGTPELAVSHKYYSEEDLVTTTTISSGATSPATMYSTTGRSSVAHRLIGTILNTQTTAGTWASAGAQVQLKPTQSFKGPTVQKFTSGTGTYVTPAGAKYIKVKMVGGGGGGSGGGQNGTTGNGGTGGNTTFGSSLLTANGGTFGTGGSTTVNSPAVELVAIAGGTGSEGSYTATAGGGYPANSIGSPSPFGGAGGAAGAGGTGNAAKANSGSGGGGGSGDASSSQRGGTGGAAGGYIEALIVSPLSSYAYGVGAAGAAGTAGTNGFVGGAGGSGVVIVEEFYQ